MGVRDEFLAGLEGFEWDAGNSEKNWRSHEVRQTEAEQVLLKSKRSLKPIPKFASEAGERQFWETHDSADYVDWSRASIVSLPNLKPSTETISLRLPAPLLNDLKALANKRDVPYQSLLKVFVADRVAEEWRSSQHRGALSKAPQPTSRRRQKAAIKPARRAARG